MAIAAFCRSITALTIGFLFIIHSVQGYTFIEENFPGLFTADTGLPQALDDIKSKKNQFQRRKNFT